MNRITIHSVTRTNWRDALRLTVRADQQRFVADYAPVAAIILAKTYVGALGMLWEPYALVAQGELVGMVALAAEPEHASQCWIFHFFIDQRYQGHGYGREALAALIAWVRNQHPACQSLHLTVHPENHVAQRLYASAGFAPTGEEMEGEPIYRLTLWKSNE